MSADGALRVGRTSEGSARSGNAGGVGYWREQWWSNMHTDSRRSISSQAGEENHNQEDSKEVRGVGNPPGWREEFTSLIHSSGVFREYWVTAFLGTNRGTS